MPLPQTLRATVSPDTIDKVGRLFNGGPADVVNELLQNARRAGATRIDIDILSDEGRERLRIRDDGRGIGDPRAVLALGQSDWTESTLASEDPAGMGVFAMAGLRVEYRSWSHADGLGWRMVIEPDAWSGKRMVAVEASDIRQGTEVLLDVPEAWGRQTLDRAIEGAARHYALPVTFQDNLLERRDWLHGAVRIESWRGSRIGVFQERGRYASDPTLNFHGVTVPLVLPSVGEIDCGLCWTARLDIGDTPELQLVLPARKEVVQTSFVAELKGACEAAIYRAIEAKRIHRLAFKDYARARELGIPLLEADPMLRAWIPGVPYGGEAPLGAPARRPMIRMGIFPATLEQTAARAIAFNTEIDLPLVSEEQRFEGYSWYDALESVSSLGIVIERGGITTTVREDSDGVDLASGTADRIIVAIEIDAADATSRGLSLPTDIAMVTIDDYASDLDGLALCVAPDPTIEVPALVELLIQAAFSPSDDHDADSYDTQRTNFTREALQLARTHLLGADAGIIGRAISRVEDHIRWLVPEGRTLLIAVSRAEVMAVFDERPSSLQPETEFLRAIADLATAGVGDPDRALAALADISTACETRRHQRLTRTGFGAGGEGGGGEDRAASAA